MQTELQIAHDMLIDAIGPTDAPPFTNLKEARDYYALLRTRKNAYFAALTNYLVPRELLVANLRATIIRLEDENNRLKRGE